MSLHVGYDVEIFVRQTQGGISRYVSGLVGGLIDQPELGVVPTVLAKRISNEHLLGVGRESIPRKPLRPYSRGMTRALSGPPWLKDLVLDYRSGRSPRVPHINVLHASYYRPRRRDVGRTTKRVFTVYDLIPEKLGVVGSMNHAGRAEAFASAAMIFSISEATSADFHKFYPEFAHKLVVVPPAVDHQIFHPRAGSESDVPFKYLLHVGSRSGYKNFEVVPTALARVREKLGVDLGLVLAGPPLTPVEQELVTNCLPLGRVQVRHPSDAALADLYRQAEAFVFPSVMEGFGIPLVEAAASGCPAVAADIPPFREIAQDSALYFEPQSVKALSEAVCRLLESTDLRQVLRDSGLERSEEYSWHKSAALAAKSYAACTEM